MTRHLIRSLVVVGLVVLGWAAGRAQGQPQAPAPDFELVIHGAPGDTEVICRKGCRLAYRDDSPYPNVRAQEELHATQREKVGFACSEQGRCELVVAGFVQR
jgi:hypothetical protein